MPKNKEESDFELNYVSKEKDTYQMYRTSTPPPSGPSPTYGENIGQVADRESPMLNNNYMEPDTYCDPRDQVINSDN